MFIPPRAASLHGINMHGLLPASHSPPCSSLKTSSGKK